MELFSKIIGKIPEKLTGPSISRIQSCRICGYSTATLVGKIEYWDIRESNLAKCDHCGLIQLDPMPADDETAKGCLAYYIEESLRVTPKEQERNLIRNFRRGVLFGHSLQKKKINPTRILELGPGSGYFSAGLKFIFPDALITILDINSEVLELNKSNFGFETIHAVPDKVMDNLEGKFDLIIARDILEHVTDISKVISNVARYLKPEGVFHFITPNGHEDVWKHYLTYRSSNKPSELLINHVNYFDGNGLKELLSKHGLTPLDYYTYKIKTTLKGRGWKHGKKLWANTSVSKSADYYISEKIHEAKPFRFNPATVLDKWYISNKRKFLAIWVSRYHHSSKIKLSPGLNVGHEIYSLFRKSG
jgi:SAM-dependent methyltransferase